MLDLDSMLRLDAHLLKNTIISKKIPIRLFEEIKGQIESVLMRSHNILETSFYKFKS
jgi:hypothetical protein